MNEPFDTPRVRPSKAPDGTSPDPNRPDPVALARLRRLWLRRCRTDGPTAPWLHEEIARRMAQRLEIFRRRPDTVLQWWDVIGAGNEALRMAYPDARHLAVRPWAPSQLESAPSAEATPTRRWWQRLTVPRAERAVTAARAATVVDDASLEPAAVDLLWANMALHWQDDAPSAFARWHALLADEGVLMFTTFGPDTLRELAQVYRHERFGPCAAPFVDMHDIGDALMHAGFADPVMDQERLTLTWPDAHTMLLELRTMGVNTSSMRFAGLRTPRWRTRLQSAVDVEGEAAPNGRVAMTFEIVYGHAFKVARSQGVGLESLRATLPSRRGTDG
jgi:malonyl-CoA O-methyltransferase